MCGGSGFCSELIGTRREEVMYVLLYLVLYCVVNKNKKEKEKKGNPFFSHYKGQVYHYKGQVYHYKG